MENKSALALMPAWPQEQPSDELAERCVLGALVCYPEQCIARFGLSVDPALFSFPACRTMFVAAVALIDAGAPLNLLTLTQKLRDLGQLDNVGGPYEVTRLATEFNTPPALAEYHLNRLRDKLALRLGLEAGQWLAETCRSNGVDPSEIVAEMMQRMERITSVRDSAEASALPLGLLPQAAQLDADELLRKRFLCRGGGLLLVGPTGVGKSSLSMQAMICWSLGRPFFGIDPARPLRSLLIQAENDTGDMAEMRDGVFEGLGLTEADRAIAGENIVCFQESARSGQEFFSRTVEPLLRLHRPDLLWIDPALSFLDGEANSQADVGRFLRSWLNPLLRKYGCAAIVVHHSNKPPSGKEKSTWSGSELAYLGSGSSEWANWPRAVVAVRSLGANNVFELALGKRGGRVGWRDDDGSLTYKTLIAHAKESGRIYWRKAEEGERPSTGGKSKRFTVEQLLEHVSQDGTKANALERKVRAETRMSRSQFFNLLKEAAKSGRLHKEKGSQVWQLVQTVQ